MAKDYYVILGVPKDAVQRDIRDSWKRLAKQFHPDLSGADATAFREVQEAYSVLGEPGSRRAYDERLRRGQARRATAPGDLPPAEPLIPCDSVPPRRGGLARMGSVGRHMSPVFDWLWDHYTSVSERSTPGVASEVTILLSSEQARSGGYVRLPVPVQAACPACRGRGGFGPHSCWQCAGEGAISGEVGVAVPVAPGVCSGEIAEIPLSGYGLGPSVLRVRVEVGL